MVSGNCFFIIPVNFDFDEIKTIEEARAVADEKHVEYEKRHAVGDILNLATEAYRTGSVELARQVEPLEETIDEMIEDLRGRHVFRMTRGLCDVYNGIQFQNILLNLERTSDQCSDLAVYLLGVHDPEIVGNEHQYVHDLHHSGNEEYLAEFQRDRAKYFAELNKINPLEAVTYVPTDIDEDSGSEFNQGWMMN